MGAVFHDRRNAHSGSRCHHCRDDLSWNGRVHAFSVCGVRTSGRRSLVQPFVLFWFMGCLGCDGHAGICSCRTCTLACAVTGFSVRDGIASAPCSLFRGCGLRRDARTHHAARQCSGKPQKRMGGLLHHDLSSGTVILSAGQGGVLAHTSHGWMHTMWSVHTGMPLRSAGWKSAGSRKSGAFLYPVP